MVAEVARSLSEDYTDFQAGRSEFSPQIVLPHGGPESKLQGEICQKRVFGIVSEMPGILSLRETVKDSEEDAQGIDIVAEHALLGQLLFQVKSIDYNLRKFLSHTIPTKLNAQGLPSEPADVRKFLDNGHWIVVNAGHIKHSSSHALEKVTDEDIRSSIDSRICELMTLEHLN